MLYLWARGLAAASSLKPPAIVAKTMSNLGLELALRDLGIETVRCDVGDRVVVETMRRHGIVLGGEQSGHLIHLGLGSTGDAGDLPALRRLLAANAPGVAKAALETMDSLDAEKTLVLAREARLNPSLSPETRQALDRYISQRESGNAT